MKKITTTNITEEIIPLEEHLQITGTNVTVRCAIPEGVQVSLEVSGTNADLEVGGPGTASINISGTNSDVIYGNNLSVTNIEVKGINSSIISKELPDLTNQVNKYDRYSINSGNSPETIEESIIESQNDFTVDNNNDEDQSVGDTEIYTPDSDPTEETRIFDESNVDSNYCSHCNAELIDSNALYCRKCGAQI